MAVIHRLPVDEVNGHYTPVQVYKLHKRDGSLVDDFFIDYGPNSIHICNAPSPAATASIEIGKAIVDKIPEQSHLKAYDIS